MPFALRAENQDRLILSVCLSVCLSDYGGEFLFVKVNFVNFHRLTPPFPAALRPRFFLLYRKKGNSASPVLPPKMGHVRGLFWGDFGFGRAGVCHVGQGFPGNWAIGARARGLCAFPHRSGYCLVINGEAAFSIMRLVPTLSKATSMSASPPMGWLGLGACFPGSKFRALPAGAQLRLSTFFHPFLPHSTANPAYTNSRSQLCFLEALIL